MNNHDQEELLTAAYEREWYDLKSNNTVHRSISKRRPQDDEPQERVGLRIHELVRRSDAEKARAKRYSQGRKDGRNLERNRIKQLIQDNIEEVNNIGHEKCMKSEECYCSRAENLLEELLEEVQPA